MTMRGLSLGVALAAACLPLLADADQSPALPRIGVLMPPVTAMEEGLRQGLTELGYIEGKSLIVEWRRSAGQGDELRSLAAELARSKVELVVGLGTPSARALMDATSTIPVVFHVGDPVKMGLVASIARPGGRATGVSVLSTELTAKRLEFLQLLVPRARRIVYLWNGSNPAAAPLREEAQHAAQKLGLHLETVSAGTIPEIDRALRDMRRSGADGCLLGGDLLYVAEHARITRAIREARLPTVFPYPEFHDSGALISYGPSLQADMRRVARYIDKILKGEKPSGLPVDQVSKFELVVDLREARSIGIEVAQTLTYRADEVIQ
jgi:putative tryptophan/tyrosine transport system substrate-binding protein